ncbi:biotinidase isoform X1 [Callorhinchus milii]|uniref:biotinidase isoform X1 n=1 Tax=Callorhinchus milii TaxID=7868 RepID=UPI001C3F8A62|nr:biotinidase isoform X1 [Callorhinchus milii]
MQRVGVRRLRLQVLFLFWPAMVMHPVVCGKEFYMAAVYEHKTVLNATAGSPPTRETALNHMRKNLDIYQHQVNTASKQGAQIIVFPEDGLYGFSFNRTTIYPYLEPIPDPAIVNWNPCLNPTKFNNTEVVHQLSCMARNSSIYLVVNMGDRQACAHGDPHCPPDGRYQFNTNVVFNDQGTLIAKYHKQNLFFEVAFNVPQQTEHIIFNTTFAGRFGILTCFDILFYDPAVSLIEKYGVNQLVFPTAWMNELPLLTAIQFQRAFATLFQINLLAANQHHPERNMTGSGIYTPSSSLYYHNMESSQGKLLVAKVPIISPNRVRNLGLPQLQMKRAFVKRIMMSVAKKARQKPNERVTHSALPISAPGSIFHGLMMHDNYTFVPVTDAKGNLQVCNNYLCCHLAYNRTNPTIDLYALGAFDGHHKGTGYYLQVCALVKCAGPDYNTCGEGVTSASNILDFTLWGNFSTQHVFPEILASEIKVYQPDSIKWEKDNFYMTKKTMSEGLVTAALYGRWYKRDIGSTRILNNFH